MFFNLCRSTKAAQREYEQSKLSSIGKNIITPKQRILNFQKRKKLKDLLLIKFMKKYKLKNPEQLIDNEITNFVQGEKLTDKDLQNLDNTIAKILTTRKSCLNLKSALNHNLSEKNINLNQSQENLPLIQPNQNNQNSDSSGLNQLDNNSLSLRKLRPSQSMEILSRHKKIYQNPEEELADLEAELALQEPKKEPIRRLDFSGLGDEWYAMASYNKMLYEKQLLEERKKEAEMKRRTRDELDNQIKNKLKIELEEKMKEKEEERIRKEHLKHIDILEKEKREKIKQQILKEKMSRESQIKDEYTRRRIEQIKQRKFDLNLIKNINEEMEKEKKAAIEKRIKENEALKKVLKENEINKEKQRELLKKQKEDDIQSYKEMEKNEIKKDLARKRYFEGIRRSAHQYDEKKTSAIINKINNEQKSQDDRLYELMLEKNKKDEEKEMKDKIKRKADKIKLKKFLDMQIEEKKKEMDFLKNLDDEQGRIWDIDGKKFNEDQNKINNIIKNINKKNLNIIKEQIKKKEKEKQNQKNNLMSIDEYAMNRKFLEEAKMELEQAKQ